MKYLRRFCSEQVLILLERMDQHWDDEFAIDGTKWEAMLPYGEAFERFTRVEQLCIRTTARAQTTKMRKEQAYTGILERTMSTAKTKWDFDEEKRKEWQGAITGASIAKGLQPSQMLTTAAIRQQMMAMMNNTAQYAQGYQDSRALYGQAVK